MSNYRRYRGQGGCYFFTVNLLKRDQHLLTEHIDSLRHAFRVVKQQRGFQIASVGCISEASYTIDFGYWWMTAKALSTLH